MEDDIFYLTTKELSDKLMQSNNQVEVNDIISLFNQNLQKKEIIRAATLSDLQDDLAKQIGLRVQNSSDCFSNKDLIDYFRTIQGVLDSQKNSTNVPQIAIQSNVIINNDTNEQLSKESRERIQDFIKGVLGQKQINGNQDIIDIDQDQEDNQLGNDTET